jgi:capsular polysaccharide biosynthesis protein
MQGTKERRRKYLVNRKLQMEFSLLMIMQVVIPIVLLWSSLYVVNKMYLSSLQVMVGEEALSDVYIKSILNFSIQAAIALIVITAVLLTFIGIRFSHHVAGPLYKLELILDKLARGEKVKPLQFRKTDSIVGFADKINIIIKKLNLLE